MGESEIRYARSASTRLLNRIACSIQVLSLSVIGIFFNRTEVFGAGRSSFGPGSRNFNTIALKFVYFAGRTSNEYYLSRCISVLEDFASLFKFEGLAAEFFGRIPSFY